MTHPDLPGQPIQVENESRIPVLAKSGWVVDNDDSDGEDDEDDHPDPIAVPAFVEAHSLDPVPAAGEDGTTPPADAGLL